MEWYKWKRVIRTEPFPVLWVIPIIAISFTSCGQTIRRNSVVKFTRALAIGLAILLGFVGFGEFLAGRQLLKQQNETLLLQAQRVHGLSDAQMTSIRKIFAKSGYIGQGNQQSLSIRSRPSR